jgi:DmsE family decaheme c-type cytochrome
MRLRLAEIREILRLRNALPLCLIVLFSWLIMKQPASSEETAGPTNSEATPVATENDSPADDSPTDSDSEAEDDPERPLMNWFGESPHWAPGQEFSAVQGAPFIGSQECTYCHKELKTDFLHTAHARTLLSDKLPLDSQGCEMCHGAGGAHAVLRSRGTIFAFDWKDSKNADQICLRCHTWLTSDHEWLRTSHSKAGVSCVKCHNPHQAHDENNERFLLVSQQDRLCATCHRDAANEFTRFSHHPVRMDKGQEPGASAMHCTSCHDVHSGTERAMLATRRVSDTCAKCHADKAGPFVFEHMGAQEGIGEGCMTCHAQHGSLSPTLLIADGRALCMQCHTDQAQHNFPMTCWTSGCHSDVHGSNHSFLLLGEQQ